MGLACGGVDHGRGAGIGIGEGARFIQDRPWVRDHAGIAGSDIPYTGVDRRAPEWGAMDGGIAGLYDRQRRLDTGGKGNRPGPL